jgi:hypothetical protein
VGITTPSEEELIVTRELAVTREPPILHHAACPEVDVETPNSFQVRFIQADPLCLEISADAINIRALREHCASLTEAPCDTHGCRLDTVLCRDLRNFLTLERSVLTGPKYAVHGGDYSEASPELDELGSLIHRVDLELVDGRHDSGVAAHVHDEGCVVVGDANVAR